MSDFDPRRTDDPAGVRAYATSQALYDRITRDAVACAGPTFQCGLLRNPQTGREDPAYSNVELARRAGVVPGARVLDAGCGVCGPAVHIALAFAGVRIDAVTHSGVTAEVARERVAAAGVSDRVTVVQGDFHSVPVEDGAYDVALMLESSGYSYDLPRLAAELMRVVRPGGRLLIKDVFAREGARTDPQQDDLSAFDAVWAFESRPISTLVQALEQGGFVDVTAREMDDELGMDRFFGACYELTTEGRFQPTALGRHLRLAYADLPTVFGELRARRPAAAP